MIANHQENKSVVEINDDEDGEEIQEELIQSGTNILDDYEPTNTNYTRGIEITQATFHGTHHFSIWEFSGYQPYRIVYDRFVGADDSHACIHLVAYNLTRPHAECLRECATWLEYLRARIAPDPISQSPMTASSTPSSSLHSNGPSASASATSIHRTSSDVVASSSSSCSFNQAGMSQTRPSFRGVSCYIIYFFLFYFLFNISE